MGRLKKYDKLINLNIMPKTFNLKQRNSSGSSVNSQDRSSSENRGSFEASNSSSSVNSKSKRDRRRTITGRSNSNGYSSKTIHSNDDEIESAASSSSSVRSSVNNRSSQCDNDEEEEEVDTGIEETDGPPGSKRRLADVFPVLERSVVALFLNFPFIFFIFPLFR